VIDMNPLRIAFKEWAVVCRALAAGRQALILRKGGIAESRGEFRVEHTRFWLYPTFVHQQDAGIIEEARPLLHEAQADHPPAGMIQLSHFAEVPCVYHIDDLQKAWKLAGLHIWSQETVEERFSYRTPGLYVVPVRIYRARTQVLPELPAYAGCKSWVDLEQNLAIEDAEPVLSEREFDAVANTLDRILEPTALA
jgi:hypothetical protein